MADESCSSHQTPPHLGYVFEFAIGRPNVLVRFEVKTEKFRRWVIRGGGGVVRVFKVSCFR